MYVKTQPHSNTHPEPLMLLAAERSLLLTRSFSLMVVGQSVSVAFMQMISTYPPVLPLFYCLQMKWSKVAHFHTPLLASLSLFIVRKVLTE